MRGLIRGIPVVLVMVLVSACDHGLEPPDIAASGKISGTITYVGDWPPADSVQDLRFVAMRFVPRDTLDFLQLNRMAISNRLAYGVQSEAFMITDVEPGVFVYSGVAQQQTSDILSWRPVGLLDGDGGVFSVEPGEEATLTVTVDFGDLPTFPPDR